MNIAYFLVGYFTFSNAQVLNQSKADSLIHIISTEEFPDTLRYKIAMDIADYSTVPRLSLEYAKQSLEIASTLENPLWQGAALLNIAKWYRKLGDGESALNAAMSSISYYQLANSQLGVSSGYLILGDIYSRQENISRALKYYKQSIKIFREEQDSSRLATVLLNTGNVYQENYQYDSALRFIREAKVLFGKLQIEIGEAYATGNLGLLEIEQGNYISGEENLNEAIARLEKFGDNYAIAEYQLSLSKIYQSRGDTVAALNYAQQSWEMAEQDGLLEQMRNVSERLASIYVQRGDYEQAYLHQTRYLKLKDSINNIEVVQNLADMRTEFEVAQKQSEIDLLTEKRNSQRKIQVGLILLLLLIVVVAWLFYRSYCIQKKANEQLNQQKKELNAKNEMLDALIVTRERFFSIISHDLRGPVGSFYSLASILKMHLQKQEYVNLPPIIDHIEKSAIHLSLMLDNLLNWALNQQDDIPIQPEKLLVKEITDEVVEVFQTVALSKNITLSSLIDTSLYAWVDRNVLFTIIRNLTNNALKFTPVNGAVTITAQRSGGDVVIQVIDTGIGISAEKLETLFQPQEGQSTWGTSGEKGVGLGLQLVKEFTDRSSGTIDVVSVPGSGTTFSVRLPADRKEKVIA
ncbi:tetratricopeptide repeat-containing sensor histidine kinase [Tunicatimonas pelagia]|uniref:tetratricopeptide repeat-containing sensor histidine kinase n=1 Tax=Tunicatimonas pelagia TaxID=931531 RepID=UPI0026658850|nr:tetratricopeptide repeat protein [Tunicatimonas pelagia]WKN42804.1 tetratricopeptide repeat protein [Tunicatimonas pelagia]